MILLYQKHTTSDDKIYSEILKTAYMLPVDFTPEKHTTLCI